MRNCIKQLVNYGLKTILFVFLGVGSANAQWCEQQIVLQPGWNAVFLEVDPVNNSSTEMFSGVPVKSVWMWNSTTTSVEYIQDPNSLVPEQPQWLVYFPEAWPHSFKTNLHKIRGERSYLIELDGSEPQTITITGRPCLPKIKWKPDSMNFVGFHVDSTQGPFFSEFFEPAAAHGNAAPEVYLLNTNGSWEQINSPSTTRINKGEAYWIKCTGDSDYTGPVQVKTEQGTGLDYGNALVENNLTITNHTGSSEAVSFNLVTVTTGPAADGVLPLSWWQLPPAAGAGWNELTSMTTLDWEAGEERDLRLAANRASLGTGNYQSLLSVTTTSGISILIPVTAENTSDRTGLWVGYALINKVSQPSVSDTPTPTASEAQIRIILHVDASGQVRLLKEVTQMWEDGTDTTPGKYVLVTDDAQIANYTGSSIRDGRPVGRRISSPAFSFSYPVSMSGVFTAGNTITAGIEIGFNDPLNPFKHKYHPDHNNLDDHYVTTIEEAFTINRTISLELTDTDQTNLNMSLAGWGDTAMGGIYREDISGVHKETVKVEGVFRLSKISDIDSLIQ